MRFGNVKTFSELSIPFSDSSSPGNKFLFMLGLVVTSRFGFEGLLPFRLFAFGLFVFGLFVFGLLVFGDK
jgi:hypothetical protein